MNCYFFVSCSQSYTISYLPPEQEYPLGQQCTPSEQQTAFGKGQHPYSPDESLQQVFPLGHSDWPSGHSTLCKLKLIISFAIIVSTDWVQKPKKKNSYLLYFETKYSYLKNVIIEK